MKVSQTNDRRSREILTALPRAESVVRTEPADLRKALCRCGLCPVVLSEAARRQRRAG